MNLRPYQSESIAAVYEHLRTRDDNPCVVIPTGGGKTPVMATICRDAVGHWGGRVVLLAHVKELLEQAADKLHAMAPGRADGRLLGWPEAGTPAPVIVAGIQSVWKKAGDLGSFDLIIIDEAHMIPAEGDGMYRTFLADAKVVNPNVRIIGLTATPYRMTAARSAAAENLLNHVCYEVGVRELIVQGFLCPLKTKAGRQKIDTDRPARPRRRVRRRRGRGPHGRGGPGCGRLPRDRRAHRRPQRHADLRRGRPARRSTSSSAQPSTASSAASSAATRRRVERAGDARASSARGSSSTCATSTC